MRNFFAETSAIAALEYGLIAGVLGIVIVITFWSYGGLAGSLYFLFFGIGRSI